MAKEQQLRVHRLPAGCTISGYSLSLPLPLLPRPPPALLLLLLQMPTSRTLALSAAQPLRQTLSTCSSSTSFPLQSSRRTAQA
jgi:hypothetical protein